MMMASRPPPTPPCPWAYDDPAEYERLQAAYMLDHAAYCRELDRNAVGAIIMALCPCIMVLLLAICGPGIFVDAMTILARP